jgi:hypothetical protein
LLLLRLLYREPFFYVKLASYSYSTIVKFLLLFNTYQRVLSKPLGLDTMLGSYYRLCAYHRTQIYTRLTHLSVHLIDAIPNPGQRRAALLYTINNYGVISLLVAVKPVAVREVGKPG